MELPATNDDADLRMGMHWRYARYSADPYVVRHVNSRLLGCRTSVGRHPSHISRPITGTRAREHGNTGTRHREHGTWEHGTRHYGCYSTMAARDGRKGEAFNA
jgi:hypothetical protein